ncbi:MAG: tRNA dihydrouridine synthase DusB [Chloroflexota bacterium]
MNDHILLQPIDIGGVRVPNRIFLAPMAGQSSYAFRTLAREYGDCGLVCTELISSEAMRTAEGTERAKLKFDWVPAEESPLAVQLFGSDPAQMATAARLVADHGADIIDINMGCWVPKVARSGGGAVLLKDVDKAAAVVEGVINAVNIPVTVKIRAGWERSNPTAVPFARAAADLGVALITVHWRFATQGFQQLKPDWSVIRQVKDVVDIPVIGNGDVMNATAAARMVEETGCDGVMIGRGALGKPWVFRDIAHELRTGQHAPGATYEQRAWTALRQAQITMATTPREEEDQIRILRAQLVRYTKGIPYATRIREKIVKATTLEEIETALAPILPLSDASRFLAV